MNILRICVNFFHCINCGTKWVFVCYNPTGDMCPNCSSITHYDDYKVINIKNKKFNKCVIGPFYHLNSAFLCPSNRYRDKITNQQFTQGIQ